MTGGGIIASVGVVLGYLIVIGIVVAIVVGAIVIITQYRAQQADPQQNNQSEMSLRSMMDGVRSVVGFPRGQVLGRAVAGIDPPSVADRLAAASAQHVVAPSQEVIMTGTVGSSLCLGADGEVMLEVLNDIGADQIDVSYSFENLASSSFSHSSVIPTRPIKVASCGAGSVVKQCIPLPPEGRGVKLHSLAYYYETALIPVDDTDGTVTKRVAAPVREENRIHPSIFNRIFLKTSDKVRIAASEFLVAV